MVRKCVAALALVSAAGLWGQGLNTQANKDDWEEINFEYNSSVLVDGFPSLLRLAELLQNNGGYKVQVEGHTDGIGSDSFNQRLGLARANTVRDFLVKYGARANQISTISRGKTAPKVPNPNPVFKPTDEVRWMNRRVVLTVTDEQGRTIGAGGPGEAIRAITNNQAAQQAGVNDCCSEVLKRLDRLDEIARMLRDLADQNAGLRRDLDALRQNQQGIENRLNQPTPPPPAPPKPPSADEVANAVKAKLDAEKLPRFELLGANIGADANRDVTFTGKGRFFAPLNANFGFQAQAEYFYTRAAKEGQADFGLVDRLSKHAQVGLFASFKNASLAGNQNSGTLGQGALMIDYLFSRGKVGVFGTKAFLDNALINRDNDFNPITGARLQNVIVERYLKVTDQAGVSATVALWGKNFAEGNIGYIKSVAYGDHVGGTVRLIFPVSNHVAVTAEGGVNETLIAAGNTGRAVFGVQFGNFMRPRDYLAADHPVPMDAPRVRYEVVNRRIHIGNAPPVADAGPSLSNVPAGTVTLDGSASYDPDNDPITFQWTQDAGQTVALSNPTSAKTTFTAAAGQTYVFRLTVKDNQGGQGIARVTISTRAADRAQAIAFFANPTNIQTGQSTTLTWRTANADTVNISGIGNVPVNGSLSVAPTQTTTYTLTAVNNVNQETLTTTVVVGGPAPQLLSCFATPSTITPGQSATLNWSTSNTETVSISPGIGTVPQSGTVTVTPTQTTVYTLTATNAGGAVSSTCSISVTVGAAQLPHINRFSAVPATITSGQTSTLLWLVDNATTVTITNIGVVPANGTQDVTLTATTTYTLTATNATGSSTATATVTVSGSGGGGGTGGPKVTSFTATPPASPAPGTPVSLACTTTGATSVIVAGSIFPGPNATLTVNPTQTTTYTCAATTGAQTDTAAVTVTVGGQGGTAPVVEFPSGDFIYTSNRAITLDASASFSPVGNNPLTFHWTTSSPNVVMFNPTSPTNLVNLFGPPGNYSFDVTVTDSKGNSTTRAITVRLLLP